MELQSRRKRQTKKNLMQSNQRNRLANILKNIERVRKAVGVEYDKAYKDAAPSTEKVEHIAQMDEAIHSLLASERALSNLFEKDDWLMGLTNQQKDKYGFKRDKKG